MDRRRRERRERFRREQDARANRRRERGPGDATRYFSRPEKFEPGTPVVLFIRASTRQQKDNMPGQELALLLRAERAGWVVVAIVRSVNNCASSKLPLAIDIAEEVRGVVFGEAVNRFARPDDFDWRRGADPDQQATEEDLEALRELARGVPLVTLIPASAPPKRVKAAQTRRGIEGAKEGGRRELKRRRRAILRRAAKEAKGKGMKYRAIVALLRRRFGMNSQSTCTIHRLLKTGE